MFLLFLKNKICFILKQKKTKYEKYPKKSVLEINFTIRFSFYY